MFLVQVFPKSIQYPTLQQFCEKGIFIRSLYPNFENCYHSLNHIVKIFILPHGMSHYPNYMKCPPPGQSYIHKIQWFCTKVKQNGFLTRKRDFIRKIMCFYNQVTSTLQPRSLIIHFRGKISNDLFCLTPLKLSQMIKQNLANLASSSVQRNY